MVPKCVLCFLLVLIPQKISSQEIQTTVEIFYDNENCGTNLTEPAMVNLTLPMGRTTALDIMEGAADRSSSYRFVVTFLGEKGYRIDRINNRPSNQLCDWHLYFVRDNNYTTVVNHLHYDVPGNISRVEIVYTTPQINNLIPPEPLMPTVADNNFTVNYIIEYEDDCNNGTTLSLPPLRVVISEGNTALHVLENAVHGINDTLYQFTSTYFGSLGYHVHMIGGRSDTWGQAIPDPPCYWTFLVKAPDSSERVAPVVGVVQYVVPRDNYTVIMWYNNEEYDGGGGDDESTTDFITTSPRNAAVKSVVFSINVMCLLLLTLILFV